MASKVQRDKELKELWRQLWIASDSFSRRYTWESRFRLLNKHRSVANYYLPMECRLLEHTHHPTNRMCEGACFGPDDSFRVIEPDTCWRWITKDSHYYTQYNYSTVWRNTYRQTRYDTTDWDRIRSYSKEFDFPVDLISCAGCGFRSSRKKVHYRSTVGLAFHYGFKRYSDFVGLGVVGSEIPNPLCMACWNKHRAKVRPFQDILDNRHDIKQLEKEIAWQAKMTREQSKKPLSRLVTLESF